MEKIPIIDHRSLVIILGAKYEYSSDCIVQDAKMDFES